LKIWPQLANLADIYESREGALISHQECDMSWLLYLFGAYLIACYAWAIYLSIRLYTGKRLRVVVFGARNSSSASQVAMADNSALLPTNKPTPAGAPTRRKAAA